MDFGIFFFTIRLTSMEKDGNRFFTPHLYAVFFCSMYSIVAINFSMAKNAPISCKYNEIRISGRKNWANRNTIAVNNTFSLLCVWMHVCVSFCRLFCIMHLQYVCLALFFTHFRPDVSSLSEIFANISRKIRFRIHIHKT